MRIRNDVAKSVVMDYIAETFQGFNFSVANVAGMIAAKLYVHNNFEKILPVISQGGFIDIDAMEQIVMPEMERLGVIEMPGLGTKYSFTVEDVKKLIHKLKQKAEQ